MRAPHLPPELWRVTVNYPLHVRRGYGGPASKTFADEEFARDHLVYARQRGAEAHLFRAEPHWQEVE